MSVINKSHPVWLVESTRSFIAMRRWRLPRQCRARALSLSFRFAHPNRRASRPSGSSTFGGSCLQVLPHISNPVARGFNVPCPLPLGLRHHQLLPQRLMVVLRQWQAIRVRTKLMRRPRLKYRKPRTRPQCPLSLKVTPTSAMVVQPPPPGLPTVAQPAASSTCA